MSSGLVVVLIVVAVVLAIVIPLVVIRQRYIKAFEALGWKFVNTPLVNIVYGLNVPPFGLGENRKVDEQVIGTTSSGVHFQAFAYTSSMASVPGFAVTMPLPQSFPEFLMVPAGRALPPSACAVVVSNPSFQVMAVDSPYGEAISRLLAGPVAGLFALGATQVSIDHDQLVALGAPIDAKGLQPFVEAMAPLASALSAGGLDQFEGPPPPPELSVYGRPDWVFRNNDNSLLESVIYTRGGSSHEAVNIVFCNTAPLPFIRLTHKWTTTSTSTDSEGRTTTTTHHHSEELFEIHPTFPFGDFKVNEGWFGNKRTFESDAFNQQFTIRTSDPRFASDLFHPRMMEFMMAAQPGPFQFDGRGHLQIDFAGSTTTIESAHAFLMDFFSRVPNFVWENLGLDEPPVPLHNSIAPPA